MTENKKYFEIVVVIVLLSCILIAIKTINNFVNKIHYVEQENIRFSERPTPLYVQKCDEIEQKNVILWGKIPKQNFCPHCGEFSVTKFCTSCGKERGNIPYIGVYCPKCDPKGKYPSFTDDVNMICGNCGSKKTWKYIYKERQTDPNDSVEFREGTIEHGWIEIYDPNMKIIIDETNG